MVVSSVEKSRRNDSIIKAITGMPSCNVRGCTEVLRRCKVCLLLYCPEHDKKKCIEHEFSMPSYHIDGGV